MQEPALGPEDEARIAAMQGLERVLRLVLAHDEGVEPPQALSPMDRLTVLGNVVAETLMEEAARRADPRDTAWMEIWWQIVRHPVRRDFWMARPPQEREEL